jgi:hypothetical protein
VRNRTIRLMRQYETTLDRVGLALGVGSVVGGVVALALTLLRGEYGLLNLLLSGMLGTLFTGIAITAVAGPIWLVMHVAGLRQPHHAALVGAFVALAIFVGAQTYQFGLLDVPAIDGKTWMFRWISAIATSLILALIAAGTALLMWRVAYREQRDF